VSELELSRKHSEFMEQFLRFIAMRELRYPTCSTCGRILSFSERLCVQHPRGAIEWHLASGRGSLRAVVEYRLQYVASMPAPYVVAVVELKEGPRLVGTVTRPSLNAIAAGQAVQAEFDAANRLIFVADPDQGNRGNFET